MNREHWKELLPVITAFANGDKIQVYQPVSGWMTLTNPNFDRTDKGAYRIAPKPRKVWVNEYPGDCFSTWSSRKQADFNHGPDRIACHELDLPPLP